MAKQLSDIKKLIERGETDTAINALTNFIGNHQGSKDEAYYLPRHRLRKPRLRKIKRRQILNGQRARTQMDILCTARLLTKAKKPVRLRGKR